jgi:hypothetical protein
VRCPPGSIIFAVYDDLAGFRFMRAAELPDDLEMVLDDHRLGVSDVIPLFSCVSS